MKKIKNRVLAEKLYWVVVAIVLFVATVVRLSNLQAYPPILNRDEAALAYNAKLIAESGKDEWGVSYPIQFKSFGDYKLPGYIYGLVPFFKVFGYSDFIVRVPSALAGIAIVVVASLLTTKLVVIPESRFEFIKKLFSRLDFSQRKWIFLISLFFFSFTQVFIFYSRMAWEANVALLWLLLALYFIFEIKEKRLWIMTTLSSLFFFLAIFTYNTPLLLLPFLLILPIVFHGWKQKNVWLPVTILWLLVFIVGLLSLISVASQKSGITIFSDPTVIADYPAYRLQFPSFLQTLLGNKYTYYISILLSHFVQSLGPGFLVIHGGSHPWHSILGKGHVNWTLFMLFLIGGAFSLIQTIKAFTSLLKTKYSNLSFLRIFDNSEKSENKKFILLFYLTVISLFPSIITVDSPHATRSLFFFVMVTILAVQGFILLADAMYRKSGQLALVATCLLLLAFASESSVYLSQYFYAWRNAYPPDLQVGYRRTLLEAKKEYPDGMLSVVDESGYLYIETAWYLQLSPSEFFNTVKRLNPDQVGLYYVQQVDDIQFIDSADDVVGNSRAVLDNPEQAWQIIPQ